jgi:hypothetical protein
MTLTHAQSPKKELILLTKPLSESQVFHIKNKLTDMKGVHFCGYQPASRCLLLQYDPVGKNTADVIVKTIKNSETVGDVKIVRNKTIYEILDGGYTPSTEVANDPAEH